ncbi:uncharacterized protein F5891DRAFT_14394 [Suillus fuscotomentosus]|uniref:Uncharacterized protein n=1 Tax=Suillus fuscotomentosus TaxID=1912939 RepID=A0AAD4EPL0_9AGAM|nr:uncharacterized protein F5891DRAFT_14394 [Suillus fuscotomentosus]KAG1908448.1 hypothetical protein F5891DRAFT_14394 [Suillus fuscotomentosus]
MPNSQPLRKPSLLSRIGARIDDRPHSHYFKQREETRLRPLGNNHEGKQASVSTTGHAGRHPQAKQHVPDPSFIDRVPATRQSTTFSPDTVTQERNNHVYGILATVSISGSSPGSDIKPMSLDDAPLYSTLASSQISVDSFSPNVDQSVQHRASSRMSVDVPSACQIRWSSDRMVIDEIQHRYSTQNLPQKVYSHCALTFITRPTVSPTITCSRNTSVHSPRERTLASSVLPPTSFSLRHISLSHGRGSPCGEANSASVPPSRSLSMQHGCDKEGQVLPPTRSPPCPCTSPPPPSLIASSLSRPWGRSEFSPAAPPGIFSTKYGTPVLGEGNRSPPTSLDAVHRQCPTNRSRARARRSSSGDDASYKRRCIRQDSQPIALLFIDSHSTCNTSPQSPHSLSPINEAWLPPMEKQLQMAHESQLKARFRKFKAIIGGAVDEIKEEIVLYHKDHRKHKGAHTNTNSEPFSGVPDYLRSLERYDPPETTDTSRSQLRTSFDIEKDINNIAQTWTKLALCDSPAALGEDASDGILPGEVPYLSLSSPRINEPPMNQIRSPPFCRTADLGAVKKVQSGEVDMGDAVNLTFRRRRAVDASNANGVVIPRLPKSL